MFNPDNKSVFYAGGWMLTNPDTGTFWADETEALAWLEARMAAENAPAPAAVALPVYQITNIQVTADTLRKVGDIHWVEVGKTITITGNVPLPNGELMLMIERMVRSSTVVGDIRRPVTIHNNVLTLTFTPKETGFLVLEKDRFNNGLIEAKHDFQVAFETVEFDVYDPI